MLVSVPTVASSLGQPFEGGDSWQDFGQQVQRVQLAQRIGDGREGEGFAQFVAHPLG